MAAHKGSGECFAEDVATMIHLSNTIVRHVHADLGRADVTFEALKVEGDGGVRRCSSRSHGRESHDPNDCAKRNRAQDSGTHFAAWAQRIELL
jgi:hypothetical protein